MPTPVEDFPPSPTPHRRKLLVLELWGLGDLTFATPLLHAARRKWEITLVGKPHAAPLLAPSFPEVSYIAYDAPWSVHHDKYALWRWDWRAFTKLVARLRRERFDAAVSVRNDPRDHLLMAMIGARRRFGFPLKGSQIFLTDPLVRSRPKQHKVEDWRDIGRALHLAEVESAEPQLDHPAYRSPKIDALFDSRRDRSLPVVCLHPGARIDVRRWPEAYFARIIEKLRGHFQFHLMLVPDPDGYGSSLEPLADSIVRPLAVDELVDLLGRVDLLLCNDSGPGHLAASCGRPAIPIFGPTDPDWFRPWGNQHHVVIRDICPWRPCFDYCKFSEPYCLTKLLPDFVWPEIHQHILALIPRGALPERLLRGAPSFVPLAV